MVVVLGTLASRQQTPFLLDHLWNVVEENCNSDRRADHMLETLGLALASDWTFGKHATQNLSQHRKDFPAYAYESFHKLGDSKLWQSLPADTTFRLKNQAKEGSATRFVQSMQSCNSRRIFRSAKGSCGLGPRIARPGDICCVLVGSQLPMIMRMRGNKWGLVGECILQGYMHGEAIKLYNDGLLELQQFSVI